MTTTPATPTASALEPAWQIAHRIARCVRGCATDEQWTELVDGIEAEITRLRPTPPSDEAREAARRIVDADEALAKAKLEKHPSFKDAVLTLAYHEVNAAAREGALTVARALIGGEEEVDHGR